VPEETSSYPVPRSGANHEWRTSQAALRTLEQLVSYAIRRAAPCGRRPFLGAEGIRRSSPE